MFDAVIFVGSTTASRLHGSFVGRPEAVLITASEPVNLSLSEGDGMPRGWMATGQENLFPHTIALSDEPSPTGRRTVSVARHSAPWRWGEGVLAQRFAAGPWRGRRLRFRASIRTTAEGFGAGAQIYIRVSSKPAGAAVLDTMADRPVRSPRWGRYAVEVEVPAAAETIEIGLLATGNGTAWFGDLGLESVS